MLLAAPADVLERARRRDPHCDVPSPSDVARVLERLALLDHGLAEENLRRVLGCDSLRALHVLRIPRALRVDQRRAALRGGRPAVTEPAADDLLTLAEVAELLRISDRRAPELVRVRDFPAPVSHVQPDEEPGVCNRNVRRALEQGRGARLLGERERAGPRRSIRAAAPVRDARRRGGADQEGARVAALPTVGIPAAVGGCLRQRFLCSVL